MFIEFYPPATTVALIGVGLSSLGQIVRHIVLDKEKLEEHKKKVKEIQDKMKEAQENNDMKGMQKHQSDLMSAMGEQMKHSFKPMLFTFLPFILVLNWMRGNFSDAGPMVAIFGHKFYWLGWYIMVSMVTGMTLSKILGNT